MDALTLIAALLLPVALGSAWLHLLVPAATPARAALVLGHGTLLGLLGTTLLLRLLDAMGQPLSFTGGAMLAGGLIALAVLVATLRSGAPTPRQPVPPSASWAQLSLGGRLLFSAILVLLLWRVGLLALEVYWRPLFPWDATMHWATKARVWFEHRALVPFTDEMTWLSAGGEGFYVDRHPFYPPAIPLLQVWINLAVERWDESLMNLPWLLGFCGLGLAFFAQLRVAGVSLPVAMCCTYILLSMPLLNIHVALAGYADLFLGATFACALMALHNWSVRRDHWQGVMLVLFAAACYLVKNEGAIWPMTMIPAIATAFMARREAAKLFLLLCLLALFGWLVIPRDWVLAGIPLSQLQPTFDLEALVGMLTTILIHDSWHLFGYLMLALAPLGAMMPGALTRDFLPLTVALVSAVGLFLFLFLFTGFGWGASNYTAVGRLSIQLAPGLTFLGALLSHELIRGRRFRRPFWLARS